MASSYERTGPINVLVVGGALSSGKTSLISHLLAQGNFDGGVGLIHMNYDRKAPSMDSCIQKMNQLALIGNGLAVVVECDPVADDLRSLVSTMVSDRGLSYLIVECFGDHRNEGVVHALLPLEGSEVHQIHLDAVVAVHDSHLPVDHLDECAKQFIALASIIVLNKVDVVDVATVAKCKADIILMNPDAAILTCRFGCVDAAALLFTYSFSCTADLLPITCFIPDNRSLQRVVYRSNCPFNPAKLRRLLKKLMGVPNMKTCIQSKGIVWIATRDVPGKWYGSAGKTIVLNQANKWFCAVPANKRPPDWRLVSQGSDGDKRQVIEFLCEGNEEKIRSIVTSLLNACLVQPGEKESKLKDRLPPWDTPAQPKFKSALAPRDVVSLRNLSEHNMAGKVKPPVAPRRPRPEAGKQLEGDKGSYRASLPVFRQNNAVPKDTRPYSIAVPSIPDVPSPTNRTKAGNTYKEAVKAVRVAVKEVATVCSIEGTINENRLMEHVKAVAKTTSHLGTLISEGCPSVEELFKAVQVEVLGFIRACRERASGGYSAAVMRRIDTLKGTVLGLLQEIKDQVVQDSKAEASRQLGDKAAEVTKELVASIRLIYTAIQRKDTGAFVQSSKKTVVLTQVLMDAETESSAVGIEQAKMKQILLQMIGEAKAALKSGDVSALDVTTKQFAACLSRFVKVAEAQQMQDAAKAQKVAEPPLSGTQTVRVPESRRSRRSTCRSREFQQPFIKATLEEQERSETPLIGKRGPPPPVPKRTAAFQTGKKQGIRDEGRVVIGAKGRIASVQVDEAAMLLDKLTAMEGYAEWRTMSLAKAAGASALLKVLSEEDWQAGPVLHRLVPLAQAVETSLMDFVVSCNEKCLDPEGTEVDIDEVAASLCKVLRKCSMLIQDIYGRDVALVEKNIVGVAAGMRHTGQQLEYLMRGAVGRRVRLVIRNITGMIYTKSLYLQQLAQQMVSTLRCIEQHYHSSKLDPNILRSEGLYLGLTVVGMAPAVEELLDLVETAVHIHLHRSTLSEQSNQDDAANDTGDTDFWGRIGSDPPLVTEGRGDGSVQAGTFARLVEFLTSPTQYDNRFVKAFITTYQSFTTPSGLFDMLVSRYTIPETVDAGLVSPEHIQPIRLRVCVVLKYWVKNQFEDFDDHLIDRIFAFVQHTLARDLGKIASMLENEIKTKLSRRERRKFVKAKDLWSNAEVRGVLGTLISAKAQTIAEQITMKMFSTFERVDAAELLNQAWNSKHLMYRAPNVIALIKGANSLSYWIASTILSVDVPKLRKKMYGKMVDVMIALHKLNNLHGLMSFVVGLNNPAVSRLKHLKSSLSSKQQKAFSQLEELMSPQGSFKAYRAHLATISPPLLPYLGVYLTDLTFIEDGNSNESNGMINFNKRDQVHRVVEGILVHKQNGYGFKIEEPLHTFVSSSAYYTDKSLFDLSLAYEPRK